MRLRDVIVVDSEGGVNGGGLMALDALGVCSGEGSECEGVSALSVIDRARSSVSEKGVDVVSVKAYKYSSSSGVVVAQATTLRKAKSCGRSSSTATERTNDARQGGKATF